MARSAERLGSFEIYHQLELGRCLATTKLRDLGIVADQMKRSKGV
jgi:hypothetical protein